LNNISLMLLEKADEEILVNRYKRIKETINEIVLPICVMKILIME